MRVLLVNTSLFAGGGDSTYTLRLADLLRGKGHTVAFFAMKDERNVPDPNDDLFVSHIDFRDLNRHRNLSAAIQVLNRSIYSGEARHKFSQLIDRFAPDVIHLGNIHAHLTPSVIVEANKRRLPVIWTLHDYKLLCPNTHFLIDQTLHICEACKEHSFYQPLLKRCKKHSYLASLVVCLEAYAHLWLGVRQRIDAFVVASTFHRNKLIERGVPADKVHHVPYFLEDQKFLGSGTSGNYFLVAGRITAIKGVRPLLEAFRLVPDARLTLVGRAEEPLASALADLLPPNARYQGLVSDDELRRLSRHAFAVLVPSLVYEGQPLSILEAFAAGKPVIASDLGGMSELVRHKERGLLVPPGDVRALADAIRWMMTHPREAVAMGQAAHRYAMQHHSQNDHLERLQQIYDSARTLNRQRTERGWRGAVSGE